MGNIRLKEREMGILVLGVFITCNGLSPTNTRSAGIPIQTV